MSSTARRPGAAPPDEIAPKRSNWARFWRHMRRNPAGFAALLFIVFVVLLAIFAPQIAPYNPYAPSAQSFQPPDLQHPFGTDIFGRDILSRDIYGARISLLVGFVATGFGMVAGSLMGMFAAVSEGSVEQVIMRFVDVLLSFPFILLAILILAFFGQGVVNVMIAIGIARIPNFTRLSHAATLTLRHREFVDAAHAGGARLGRIIRRHILPNVLQPLVVYATFSIPLAMLIEAGLDYLGLGVNPSTPTWGQIINQGQQSLLNAPWQAIAGGVAIMLTVMAFNVFGEVIGDFLEPRSEMRVRL